MNTLLQEILVGVLVAGCALYGAWRLAAVTLRLRVLDALGTLPGVKGAPWPARLRARMLGPAGGCGGCAATPRTAATPTTGAASPTRTPGALRR
jgi:hypothetical protein